MTWYPRGQWRHVWYSSGFPRPEIVERLPHTSHTWRGHTNSGGPCAAKCRVRRVLASAAGQDVTASRREAGGGAPFQRVRCRQGSRARQARWKKEGQVALLQRKTPVGTSSPSCSPQMAHL